MNSKKSYFFKKGTSNFYFSLDKKVDQITKWIRLGNPKMGFCKLRGFVHISNQIPLSKKWHLRLTTQYTLVLEQAHFKSSSNFIEFQTVKFVHVSGSTVARVF